MSEENMGKFIVPFDESQKVLKIIEIYHQDRTGNTYYRCDYIDYKSIRSFNVVNEMETFAIFDTLQEAQKAANMTVGQLIVEYIRSNRAIERLCRKSVDLKKAIKGSGA